MLIRLVIASLMAVIISFPISAEAANWVLVGTDDNKTFTTYIDTTSIQKGQGGVKEAWVKWERSPCTPFNKKCISYSLTYERHFANKSFCMLDIFYYYSDGTNDSATFSCDSKRIAPQSMAEQVWAYLFK